MSKGVYKGRVTIHCSICGQVDQNKEGHQKYLGSPAEKIQNNIVGKEEEIDIPSIIQVKFHFLVVMYKNCGTK
jgi:hypothetical protein